MSDPYTLDPDFERAVIAYLVRDRRFYGAVRGGVVSSCFPTREAQTIVEACAKCFTETGEGPGSSVVVAQQLRQMSLEDGKITLDDTLLSLGYLEDCLDQDLPPMEKVMGVFLPQLRERMRGDALRDALMGLDSTELRRRLERIDQLGFVDTSLGSKLGAASFREMDSTLTEKLPTGMPRLDDYLEGGVPRKSLYVLLGGANSGKSTGLGQMAGANLREGGLVLYGTNELPVSMVKAKIFADLTNIPFKRILAGQTKEAAERYAAMMDRLGSLYVKELDTGLTTPADIDDWRKEVEDAEGRKVDLVAIDYADRMGDGSTGDRSDYVVMRNVYNGLVAIAKDNSIVVATASQTKELKRGQKFAKLGDMADSRHKGRIATVVVSLNYFPEEQEFWLYLCKQKMGASDVELGPIPTDWDFGRVTTISPRVQAGASPTDAWKADQVVAALSPFATEVQ